MKGHKLRFVLKKAGLKYKQFAEIAGKSVVTVQRWVSYNEDVGEIYILPLRTLLTNKVFNQIEKDWDEEQKEKLRKQKEWEEKRDKDIARRKSLSQ
ncbi:MAG: hypothetical protein IPM69_03455 [Ignavibacteria bacterium]|nr:hypothetical protein [Ignavibacteria bacterium]